MLKPKKSLPGIWIVLAFYYSLQAIVKLNLYYIHFKSKKKKNMQRRMYWLKSAAITPSPLCPDMHTEATSVNTGSILCFIIMPETWWVVVLPLKIEFKFKTHHCRGCIFNALIPWPIKVEKQNERVCVSVLHLNMTVLVAADKIQTVRLIAK